MASLEPRNLQHHLAGLEAILSRSHGGWADEESLLEFRRLCRAARVAGNGGCHHQMDLLAQYAGALYSDRGHHLWDIGPVFGADILRRKIRMTLSACRAQLRGMPAPQPFNAIVRGLPDALLRRALRASPT
jgi:hypothetical protein